jgi:uncharacterized SAM-binding protein YcdF (DUF218 family)
VPPLRAVLPRLLVVAAGILTFGVFGLALWVLAHGRRDRARRAGAIVVLGAKVHPGGVPSGSLVARAQRGAALYRRGLAPLLVLSGGRGEAEAALRIALAEGVPEAACLLEQGSRSTLENARLTAPLLRERGIREIVLVTDSFHALRAERFFRAEGLDVASSPASFEGRRMSRFDRLYWPLREAFALLAWRR